MQKLPYIRETQQEMHIYSRAKNLFQANWEKNASPENFRNTITDSGNLFDWLDECLILPGAHYLTI